MILERSAEIKSIETSRCRIRNFGETVKSRKITYSGFILRGERDDIPTLLFYKRLSLRKHGISKWRINLRLVAGNRDSEKDFCIRVELQKLRKDNGDDPCNFIVTDKRDNPYEFQKIRIRLL